MLEVISASGEEKFYLPLHVVRMIKKTEDGDLMLCFENPKSEMKWWKIKSASMLSTSKKIT